MKRITRISTILASVISLTFQITVAQSIGASSSYFPLQIGNEWSFSFQSVTHTEKITDTARINGKLFYGLSVWGPTPSWWFRSSNDSVFVIQSVSDTSENLLHYFNASVGDTVKLPPMYDCSYGIRLILAGKEDTVTTSAGTYTHCYHFKHIPSCMDGGIFDTWLAKGVGRVKYMEVSFAGLRSYDLISYKVVTTVKHSHANANDGSYVLFDTYPNPFNPQTTLTYHVDKTSYVSLKIIDLLGREIANLVSDQKRPGDYQIIWNPEVMSSGIYFAVFRANDFSMIKKLVLQK